MNNISPEQNNKGIDIKKSTKELLIAILNKDPKKIFKINYVIFGIMFILSLVFSFGFIKFGIGLIYFKGLLEMLITTYSIIIGFTFTSITLLASIFDKKTIAILLKENADTYKNSNLYENTVLIFFEYIYALLVSLLFILSAYFIYPFYIALIKIKILCIYVFSIILFQLLAWTFVSIKSLIFNLYTLIMFNSGIARLDDSSK